MCAPFAVGMLLLAAASAAWLVMRGLVAQALDGGQVQARAAGLELDARDRRIGGFPLRLRVSYGAVRLAARSGWAVEAPALVAQAYVYAPLHWVLVAPAGFTVMRPEGGPVHVTGLALRASVAGLDASPWRMSLVGDGVEFATPPGAHPFSLRSAVRIGLYLKPDPGGAKGDGAVLLELDKARATPGSLAWNLAPDAPVDAIARGRLTRLAPLSGADWSADWGAALQRWRRAGGVLALDQGEALGGPTELWAQGGAVGVGPGGRLVGDVPLRLRQSPQLFAGPAGAQTVAVQPLDPKTREAASSRFDLRLRDGEVRLGPVRVGPSPVVG